jgi:hypothetical protein
MPRSTDSGKLALWRERFARFSRGELPVGAFCAQERVSVASFYYWREKVGQTKQPGQGRPHASRPGVFQPITVVPVAPAVRIALPGGTRIEVGTGDIEVVRAVVEAVARPDAGRPGSDGSC